MSIGILSWKRHRLLQHGKLLLRSSGEEILSRTEVDAWTHRKHVAVNVASTDSVPHAACVA